MGRRSEALFAQQSLGKRAGPVVQATRMSLLLFLFLVGDDVDELAGDDDDFTDGFAFSVLLDAGVGLGEFFEGRFVGVSGDL